MSTPLYTTDIIPMTSRPTLTVMDDGDYFVILDTSTGKISKILKTNIMTALKITYDNTSGLTAETVQAALDELVVNLGSSDSAILALSGRLDTLEGTGEGSVEKAIDDALEPIEEDVAGLAGAGRTTETVKANADDIISIKGDGYTAGTLKTHEDRLDTLEGTGAGSVAKAIDDALEPIEEDLGELTNRTDRISKSIKTFLNGKYVSVTAVGQIWTEKLTDNSASHYLADAIDLTDYFGGKLEIKTNNRSTSSTRTFGFCNSNGVVSSFYYEQEVQFVLKEDGYYYATYDITDTHFFFSFSRPGSYTNRDITLLAYADEFLRRAKENFYTKNEVDNKITTNNKCFVSTNGSDSNDGLTRGSSLATIQKAIDLGFNKILVKEGVYSDGFTINGVNDVSIELDREYDNFSIANPVNPKIVIDGIVKSLSIGVTIENCYGCLFDSIEVKNCSEKGFKIKRCSELRFNDCIAHDIGVSNPTDSVLGFSINYTNADFYNCVAYNIGTTTVGQQVAHCDGFNIHYTGTTNFFNCSAWNCQDDGISHHDACYGLIDGGEFYNCGKGGVASPTHGAKVNISNVYCHNNQVGIYAENSSGVTEDRGNIILSNCVCVNNTYRDILVSSYYSLIAINCIYNSVIGGENITRYGITN